jgi:hypothetical protein
MGVRQAQGAEQCPRVSNAKNQSSQTRLQRHYCGLAAVNATNGNRSGVSKEFESLARAKRLMVPEKLPNWSLIRRRTDFLFFFFRQKPKHLDSKFAFLR